MTSSNPAKRRKITRACDCCRAQKKRCTGNIPCASCIRNAKTCTFLASYTRGRPVTPPPSNASVATPLTPTLSCATTFEPTTISPIQSLQSTRPSVRKSIHARNTHSQHDTPTSHPEGSWVTLQTPEIPSQPPVPDDVSEHTSDEVLSDGPFVGPGSAHSWLKQAWSCLGRVRQHVFRLHSTMTASAPSTRVDGPIFSHGDRALREDQTECTKLPKLATNTIEMVITTYFERALATYRFLHRPTHVGWLSHLQQDDAHFCPVRRAIVLMMLALGSSYMTEGDKAQLPDEDAAILRNEVLFYRAHQNLCQERGAPSIESVQARLMQVHYLLTSSRPNKAWYAFGTVVQLTFALGLHQKGYGKQNAPGLARELRRRTFWSVYKMDKSLSTSLGRPSLIREECITQELPVIANDEQIFLDRIEPESDDDCLLEADVSSIKLSRIVGRSMREYYETDDNALIQLIMSNNEKLAEWKTELPPFLSGTVKPSSLIPVLRRQATILKLFHLHTVIFINRPLLLKSFSESWSLQQDHQVKSSIKACIDAAAEIAKQAVLFNIEGQAFRAFWLSQNMTFNAVSILYLNSLRLLQEQPSLLSEAEHALVGLAEDAHKSLSSASEHNSPGQRYDIVLEQLRREVRAHLDPDGGTATQLPELDPDADRDGVDVMRQDAGYEWANLMSNETSLHEASMFWPQFDGLPLGFDDWLENDFTEPLGSLNG